MADPNTTGVFVMVPSYNHGRFVERTLRSIFSQSLRPEKLLVIDDGSTDDSVPVIERTLADCPFPCELIVRENRGICRTLNEGFGHCREEYFAYLGSDDLWATGFLDNAVRNLAGCPDTCLSFGNAYLIDEDELIMDSTENWFGFYSGNALPFLLEGKIFPSSGVLYRTRFLPNEPWYEGSPLEDYDLYLRLGQEREFVFSGETLSAWRQHGKNASSNLPKMFPEFAKAQKRCLERLNLDEGEAERLRGALMFEASFNFARHGFRREALRHMLHYAGYAGSVRRLANIAFRVLVPRSLFRWNRIRKYNAAKAKYGKFEISDPLRK